MPKNSITLNRNTVMGGTLSSVLSQLSRSLHALQTLKADLDNMTDGVDYTQIESAMGLAPGQGVSIYNLVAGSVADVNASVNTQNLIAWTGTIWL